jgi:O-antigen/teichoic acid export membrane protein
MAIFGNEHIETGYIVLIILSLGQLINCITGSVGYTLTMTGNQKIELINSILLGLMSIILNFWLIPKYGALGAAIASCSSMCLINMIRVLEIYWIFKINSLSKETYMVIFPMILSIIIMTFAHGLFSGNMKLAINILVIIGNFVFYFKMSLSNADEFIKDTIRSKLFGRTVV